MAKAIERENVGGSALFRLLAWLSPAYPVGAFSYSSGIEWAVEAGDVTNADTLRRWLAAMLTQGAGFCDAVFFVHAYRASAAEDEEYLRSAVELAAAMTPSRERFLETTAQGGAFLDTTRSTWPCPALDRLAGVAKGPIAYPVAVATAAAGHGVPLESALGAYLQALVANWVSAGIRLIPLGQTDGQRTIAALEFAVAETASRALTAALEDAGSATFRADIASMRHETQYTRLFRS
jgi:urease accessory protein